MKKVDIITFSKGTSYNSTCAMINERLAEKKLTAEDVISIDYQNNLVWVKRSEYAENR